VVAKDDDDAQIKMVTATTMSILRTARIAEQISTRVCESSADLYRKTAPGEPEAVIRVAGDV
jgi:hypothetical protein